MDELSWMDEEPTHQTKSQGQIRDEVREATLTWFEHIMGMESKSFTKRKEGKREKQEILGCAEKGHVVGWCDRGRYRRRGKMETHGWELLKEKARRRRRICDLDEQILV